MNKNYLRVLCLLNQIEKMWIVHAGYTAMPPNAWYMQSSWRRNYEDVGGFRGEFQESRSFLHLQLQCWWCWNRREREQARNRWIQRSQNPSQRRIYQEFARIYQDPSMKIQLCKSKLISFKTFLPHVYFPYGTPCRNKLYPPIALQLLKIKFQSMILVCF